MTNIFKARTLFIGLITGTTLVSAVKAQTLDGCVFKDTLLNINFGTAKNLQQFNLNGLKQYRRDFSNCPNDGYYAYVSESSECFNGDWHTIREDHTPNDQEGKMLFVNAAPEASMFFISKLTGFKPNTVYELGLWMMNICKLNSGCQPMPPQILIILETAEGSKLAEFRTGKLFQGDKPSWTRYAGMFRTPASISQVVLKMTDMIDGGCGNDFALDDITFRECYPPPPPPHPVSKKENPIMPVAKENIPKPVDSKPVLQETPRILKSDNRTVPVSVLPRTDSVIKKESIVKNRNMPVSVPLPIQTRENPVVKQITTSGEMILLELYDNGEIDGDTVSIYHNNELVVSRAGLSEKPVKFTIKADKDKPHHEVIMVANNLGKIPPNTSLMVITTAGKRYEVFISSSEQKNAKIIFDYVK
jgi:hypothetical protein